MLNICLERKSIREGRLPFAMIQQEGKTDSDDEFFDCDEDRVIDDEGAKWCMQNSSSKLIFYFQKLHINRHGTPWDEFQSWVRHFHRDQELKLIFHKRLGKMMLVNSDEPLYIPATQDPVPKTEDELEDDAEMLLNVSDSELRAQLMSASLLSDMER